MRQMLASVIAAAWALTDWSGPAAQGLQTATPTQDFLDSIGVVSSFPNRGQPLPRTVSMIRYAGFRWVRAGIEGLSENGPTTMQTFLDLHRQTGVRLSWGLVSGGTDIGRLIATGKILAQADALLAFEGNNEPNNWAVTYQGEKGGQRGSWRAVARVQRDLYDAVKRDPVLRRYPVWSISEPGAQTDNMGLQFLTIPPGSHAGMPDGTHYADAANVHNYIFHGTMLFLSDNQAWGAADPTPATHVDGLYGNFGLTWGKGFAGYPRDALGALPRVTTETGTNIDHAVTEEVQGVLLLDMLLAQFKRGYSHTAIYLLRDRTDEHGNQTYGLFQPDYRPRKAAIYLHNLTTILADRGKVARPGALPFTIKDQPATVHDLLLQNSDGSFRLVLWGERASGQDQITVDLGDRRVSATFYDPTRGIAAMGTLANTSKINVTLGNHPVVIAIGR
jgi:hypothetical protein